MIHRMNGNGTYTVDDAARALLRTMRAAAEPPTLLVTTRDAAKALAVSEKTLWTLTTPRGPIPAMDTYGEISTTQTGIKLLCIGSLPNGAATKTAE
jgi:hypothetical protein